MRHLPAENEIEERSQGTIGADGRTLRGKSPYSVPAFIPQLDLYEQLEPGVFAESIATDDVRMLIEHLPDPVLGRNKAGTLQLFEGVDGLHVIAYPPETSAADDLLVSVARGDKNGLSARFKVLAQKFDHRSDGSTLRRILKAILIDVSVVTYPAYVDATVAVGGFLAGAGPAGFERQTAEARAQHERREYQARVIATQRARLRHRMLTAYIMGDTTR